MNGRPYYEAYDDRYRQIHEANLQWFMDGPSPIVSQVMAQFGINPTERILEIGCGEGRDARFLLEQGFDVLATDVSAEAIRYARKQVPQHAHRFQVLDCIHGTLDAKFDLIYAVAVIHMLVPDSDRNGFCSFIREHLSENGIALICTMGDGEFERQSDIRTAFDLQERQHEQTGKTVHIAGTSCRVVNFQTFEEELSHNGLALLKRGITSIEPDFPQMMYAVVKKA